MVLLLQSVLSLHLSRKLRFLSLLQLLLLQLLLLLLELLLLMLLLLDMLASGSLLRPHLLLLLLLLLIRLDGVQFFEYVDEHALLVFNIGLVSVANEVHVDSPIHQVFASGCVLWIQEERLFLLEFVEVLSRYLGCDTGDVGALLLAQVVPVKTFKERVPLYLVRTVSA